jgi:hypothetical protein
MIYEPVVEQSTGSEEALPESTAPNASSEAAALIHASTPPKPSERPSKPEPPPDRPTKLDWARWLVALGVAVAAAFYFLKATAAKSVCADVLNGTQVIQSCGPPRLVDLVPFGLVIVLLLWPDLSEFGLGGVVTIRRRLNQQEQRQDALADRLLDLQQTLVQNTSTEQSQVTQNYWVDYPSSQSDLARGIANKETAFREWEAPTEGHPEDVGLDKKKESLRRALIDEYGEIAYYVSLPEAGWHKMDSYRGRALARLNPDQEQILGHWNQLYAPELRAIIQTVELAKHDQPIVSAETLEGALRNVREIKRILFDRLDARQ